MKNAMCWESSGGCMAGELSVLHHVDKDYNGQHWCVLLITDAAPNTVSSKSTHAATLRYRGCLLITISVAGNGFERTWVGV
jgi:hypothetical protein